METLICEHRGAKLVGRERLDNRPMQWCPNCGAIYRISLINWQGSKSGWTFPAVARHLEDKRKKSAKTEAKT